MLLSDKKGREGHEIGGSRIFADTQGHTPKCQHYKQKFLSCLVPSYSVPNKHAEAYNNYKTDWPIAQVYY